MDGFKPKETIYNGYRFRSRLEARWAYFFDLMDIKYEYEPQDFDIDGTRYLPDFYLPWFHCYFEVKRKGLDGKEREEAIRKISYGSFTDSWAGLIAFGDPMDDEMYLYCQEHDDDGGGPYENRVSIVLDPSCPFILWGLITWGDYKERMYHPTFNECDKYIPAFEDGLYEEEEYITNKLLYCRRKARQSRFEFGETPIIKKED